MGICVRRIQIEGREREKMVKLVRIRTYHRWFWRGVIGTYVKPFAKDSIEFFFFHHLGRQWERRWRRGWSRLRSNYQSRTNHWTTPSSNCRTELQHFRNNITTKTTIRYRSEGMADVSCHYDEACSTTCIDQLWVLMMSTWKILPLSVLILTMILRHPIWQCEPSRAYE